MHQHMIFQHKETFRKTDQRRTVRLYKQKHEAHNNNITDKSVKKLHITAVI